MKMNWFCLQTRSRFEFTVRDALAAGGAEAFLPTWEETSRWSDREKKVTRPLFTSYLFARFAAADADAIRRIRGVAQILCMGQEPVPIPDGVIGSLRQVAAHPARVACQPYVPGVTITVLRGPFAGVCGVVKRTHGAMTLSIPVEILGRSVTVKIDAADVRPVAK